MRDSIIVKIDRKLDDLAALIRPMGYHIQLRYLEDEIRILVFGDHYKITISVSPRTNMLDPYEFDKIYRQIKKARLLDMLGEL